MPALKKQYPIGLRLQHYNTLIRAISESHRNWIGHLVSAKDIFEWHLDDQIYLCYSHYDVFRDLYRVTICHIPRTLLRNDWVPHILWVESELLLHCDVGKEARDLLHRDFPTFVALQTL